MRIIVSGPIANKPGNGGIAWNVLNITIMVLILWRTGARRTATA